MSDANANQQPGMQSTGAAAAEITPRIVDGGQGWNWISQGWDLFRKNPGIWIGNIVLLCLLAIVIGSVPGIGHIAVGVLMPVMTGGLMLGCAALDRGEPLQVAHLFAGFKTNTAQLVLVGVLYMVGELIIFAMVAVVLMLAGGGAILAGLVGGNAAAMLAGGTAVLLVMIAALIAAALLVPLLMAVWFAPALVALSNAQAIDAMKQSFFACLANWVPFLIYGLITIVLAIVASIPAMLGWLVLGPVIVASAYTGYRDLFPKT